MLRPDLFGFTSLRAVGVRFRTGARAVVLAAGFCGGLLHAQSVFTQRPEDPRAVDFVKTEEAFPIHADGAGDDADALQLAINRAQERRAGVVLIPEGRYRLGKTVYVWQGIRLIGYGHQRPLFVLGANTPGYQEGTGHYMVQFADNRPAAGGPIVDATEFTFYSGMNNIDFELQDGNPAAIAVRFHVAQHSMLTHMDFQVGTARAALEDIGNQASDIHIHGGQYGIITKRTAPVWQFLLMDSTFDGQRSAAIQTMEAGITLIRDQFANLPVALEIMPGQVDQLYARDLRLENISEAALVAGDWHNLHSEVTLTNVACSNVPLFFNGEKPLKAPARNYVMDQFTLGLEIGADGREQGVQLLHHAHSLKHAAPAVPSDIPSLPPMEQWVNVRSLGIGTNDSADYADALQSAIDQHAALFFPAGTYRTSRPLQLKSDTDLIALNPGTTQITLTGSGADQIATDGDTIGVITTPAGGSNVVCSLSVSAGGRNPRIAAVVWQAGTNSLLDDVSFGGAGPGGGGRGRGPGGPGARGGTNAVTTARAGNGGFGGAGPGSGNADTQQAGDLIVRDGGGIFRGCWPHNTGSRVGLRVENTSTPGKIYQISVEHHPRIESQYFNVRNWEIYAQQTEEENPAGAEAFGIEIQDSQNVCFANTYMYRVSRNVKPKPYAVVVRGSDQITFQNVKVFSQTRLAFDNALLEEGSGVAVRAHFFTDFHVYRGMKAPKALPLPALFEKKARLELLATNFSNIAGLTASDSGAVYFTDAVNSGIYHWNPDARKAELLAQIQGQPQVLGFVPPARLLAIANQKVVYSINLAQADSAPLKAEVVKETPELLPDTILLLPVGLHNQLSVMNDMVEHRGYVFRQGSNTAIVTNVPDEHRGYFYAPDTKTAIMAGGTWRPNLQSSQLAPFSPGTSHYLTSEDDGRTYVASLDSYRKLSTTPFVERGGMAVVTDAAGNVYIANSQVWIYDRAGKPLGVLEVPQRPGSLVFGGADKRTLFIGARSSLYSIRVRPEIRN